MAESVVVRPKSKLGILARTVINSRNSAQPNIVKKEPSAHTSLASTPTVRTNAQRKPNTLTGSRHPFMANYLDHFETSDKAIQDIEPLLQELAIRSNKLKENLLVYDPFYCDGTVKTHFINCGFDSVIHENRDFYADVLHRTIPKYDVIVTNPPYSDDHKERILDFCAKSGKPWMLLLPSYVFSKEYFSLIMGTNQCDPFFLAPEQRYFLTHPKGTGYGVPLFDSFWVIDTGSMLNDTLFHWWLKTPPPACRLYRRVDQLRCAGKVESHNRASSKKRRILKRKRSEEDPLAC